MKELLNEEWHYFGSWPGIGLSDSLIWQGPHVTNRFYDEFGIWKGYVNVFTENGTTQHMYGRKALLEEIQPFLDHIITKTPHVLIEKLNKYYKFAVDYQKQCKELKNFFPGDTTQQQLADSYIAARNLQSETALYDQFGILTEDYFLSKVLDILSKTIDDDENKFHTFQLLTNPWTLSTPQKELVEMYKVICSLPDSSDVEKTLASKNYKNIRSLLIEYSLDHIKEMAEDFGWLPVFLKNQPWDESHYLTEISNLIVNSEKTNKYYFEELLRDKSSVGVANESVAREIYEKLNLSNDDQLIIDVFRLVMDTRNESEYLIGYASLSIKPIIREILGRLNISEEIFDVLYFDEISDLLLGKIEITDLPIEERYENCGYWFKDDKIFKLLNKEVSRDFLKKQKELVSDALQEDDTQKELKGTCASIGLAEGIVKVIGSIQDFDNFCKDDILVAESTTADYVPIMRMASGIIAEHGGVTCHAAIVARELGIPAIVGYPLATKTFKDGQKVSFNAIEGTVKILG